MTEWKFSVSPPHERFDTRHDAVGFKAVHGREYNYHRLGTGVPVEPRIEVFEVPTDGE